MAVATNGEGSAGSQPSGRMPSSGREHAAGNRKRLVITGGLIAMFGLFGVVAWYAYREAQDLLRGEPKLVRAPEGPYRTRPEEPGGLPVLNESAPIVTVLEGGEEPPGTERILPAQEPPARSARELLPPPEEPPTAPPQTVETAKPGGEAPTEAGSGASLAAPGEPSTQPLLPGTSGVATGDMPTPMPEKLLAEELGDTEGARDLAAIAPAAGTTPAATGGTAPEAAVEVSPAVPPDTGKAPAGPSVLAARESPPPPATAAEPTEIFRIQLAALSDEAAASRAWERFRQRYGALLEGLEPVVQPARTAGGTLYRIQAGAFASREDARSRCARIREAGGDCFVVGPVR